MCWILYSPLLHRPLNLLVCFTHVQASSRVPHDISADFSGAFHERITLTDWWLTSVYQPNMGEIAPDERANRSSVNKVDGTLSVGSVR